MSKKALLLFFSMLLLIVPFKTGAVFIPANLFRDNFEAGGDLNNLINWQKHENGTVLKPGETSGADKFSPDLGRFVKIAEDSNDEGGEDGWICRSFDASHLTNLKISYFWNGDPNSEDSGSGKDLGILEIKINNDSLADCSDVAGWTEIKTHNLTNLNWQKEGPFELPLLTNNSKFLLRFRNNSTANDEYFRIDSVSIDGDTGVVNTPPTAFDLNVKTLKNTATSSVMTASDPDGSQLIRFFFESVTKPTNGFFTFFATDGRFTYMPNKDFVGEDHFTFKANDGLEDSVHKTVHIQVIDQEELNECEKTLIVKSEVGDLVNGQVGALETLTHPNWASIPETVWIWNTTEVSTPEMDETNSFTKTFEINNIPLEAKIEILADNSYLLKINDQVVADKMGEIDNFSQIAVYDVVSYIKSGSNQIEITVKNVGLPESNSQSNPAGLSYKLSLKEDICLDPATIEIRKKVEPKDESQWNFGINLGTIFWQENIGDGFISSKIKVKPGQYTVMEQANKDLKEKYKVSLKCLNGENILFEMDNLTIEAGKDIQSDLIDVTNGDEVICTFTNTLIQEGNNQNNNDTNNTQNLTGHRQDVSSLIVSSGEVLGLATEENTGPICEPYLKSYIKLGADNDQEEVKKLQIFLNQFFEVDNPVTGFYGPITFEMVKKFQSHQESGTLAPWQVAGLPTNGPTGYVYKTTKRWINILKCPEMIKTLPIPELS